MGKRYTYKVGSKRAKKFSGNSDVRAYRALKGWEVRADLTDTNPITGRQLKRAEWWIIETYTGE